jgi:hypothetical protein
LPRSPQLLLAHAAAPVKQPPLQSVPGTSSPHT